MATKVGGYFLKDGTRVPSVTTILSRFKESGALIHWAAGQAAKYVQENLPENPTKQDIGRVCDAAKSAYRNVRDAAADAGTLAHDAVESYIHGNNFVWPEDSDIVRKAKRAFEAFVEWASQTQLITADTEMPLVSEKFRYGGTPDAVTVKGKRAILDWKSSNSIYSDYLIQVAAYGNLWNENAPNDPVIGGFHIVRFDKNSADFHHHYYKELDSAWISFQLMRDLYDLDAELKKRAK